MDVWERVRSRRRNGEETTDLQLTLTGRTVPSEPIPRRNGMTSVAVVGKKR